MICPDLAGFGASPARLTPMSMTSFADDLANLLDALDVQEPVAFCGLSMGGYIGWQFWKHHRDRLSHLVACDTRAASDMPEVARGRMIAARTVRRAGSRPVADAMIDKLFYRSNDSETKPIAEPIHQVILQTHPESIAGGQLAMAKRPDATPWLEEIDLPMLFVVGEYDEITPPEEMKANADLVAGSAFLKVNQAGHMAPLENPNVFNDGLVVFLDQTR